MVGGEIMSETTKASSSGKSKELAAELRTKLQEAYERGTSSEATKFLISEFEQLRKAYSEQLKTLRKQAGL
jgi:dynactin complex subunit